MDAGATERFWKYECIRGGGVCGRHALLSPEGGVRTIRCVRSTRMRRFLRGLGAEVRGAEADFLEACFGSQHLRAGTPEAGTQGAGTTTGNFAASQAAKPPAISATESNPLRCKRLAAMDDR
jgi:hypothetical protein